VRAGDPLRGDPATNHRSKRRRCGHSPRDRKWELPADAIQRTRRHARDVVDASGIPFAEFALDVVTYEIRAREIRHRELEIEADNVAHATSLGNLAQDLLARFGDVLRLWRSGKLATGLAVQKLLRDGNLDDHVTEGNLHPSAYDLIERYVAATSRGHRGASRPRSYP
jgi:hypothetical protein